jgi:signal transduction histidine kinase
MPSIRRSLLVYLLSLLALALGAVGVFVDRFANGAIRQREASEEERINQSFKVRQQDATAKFDADLLAETKAKARELQRAVEPILGLNRDQPRPRSGGSGSLGPPPPPSPTAGSGAAAGPAGAPAQPTQAQPPARATEDEGREFLHRICLTQLTATSNSLPAVVAAAALQPRESAFGTPGPRRFSATVLPGWIEFDGPRAIARTADALRRAFDDDHTGYFQFTLVGTYANRPDRTVTVVPSVALDGELPLAPFWLESKQLAPNQDLEPKFEDVEIAGKGMCRQVVTGTGVSGRPLVFPVALPFPTALAAPGRPPIFQSFWDVFLHVFVQHARPYSELELDPSLAAARAERDEQLARVSEETRDERHRLRSRLLLIGCATFAALVLGGWSIVARGLAPLRKLSDAVSRVSEKDFRLTVGAAELGAELAPVHARITQTLTLLQRAFAREKQAVADISHELRTPIAALLATIDVSLRKPRTPDQYRATLAECRLISKELGQLVERIMTLALLDAGNDRTQVARTDAAELAAGCAAVIRPLAAANNVSVAANLPADLPLETDPGKLREVLMNLLHNAVEYNRPGGTIELTVRPDGPGVAFEVRDTGIGMTAEVRDKIFERFFRADPSRHATGVHAGLGLAIVKEYVSRLGGAITVESELGIGTTFRVALPLAAPAQTAQAAPAAPTDRPRPRDIVAASS